MKAVKLSPNPRNPRKITDKKLDDLKRSQEEFGDLSGVVFNCRSGVLVGGNQRSKNFDASSELVVTKRYAKPTKTGTVAEGYILFNGERFNYREVDWDTPRETAAGIAANKNAGEWDQVKLSEQMRELGSFDMDYDLDLTMFDVNEREKFFPGDGVTGTADEERSPSKLVHECPRCGYEFR